MLKLNRAELRNLYDEYYNGSTVHIEYSAVLDSESSASGKHSAIIERLKEEGKITHDEFMSLSDAAGFAEYESEAMGFIMGFEYAFNLMMTN